MIRERVDRDLARPGLPREKVLAAVVRLLELTLIRVGNDEYARLNRSFGLTTLRDRHATVEGSRHPVPLPRQERQAARGRRSATGGWPGSCGRCQDLPGPGPLPVRRRRRRGARRSLRRRERLPARGHRRRRRHGQGLPDVGRAPCSPTGRCEPSSRARPSARRATTSSRRSGRPPSASATRRPSLAGATSTRRSSTPISTAHRRTRSWRRPRTRTRRRRGTTPEEEAGVVDLLRQRLEMDAGRG